MSKVVLLAGAAIALTASPALAGGPLGGGLLGGIMASSRTVNSNTSSSHRSTALGAVNCLCQTAHGLLGRGSSMGSGGNAGGLANSVVGLGAIGHGHAGRGVGLAGSVSGTVRSATSLGGYGGHGGHGIGLAGTVTGTVNSALVGHAGHGSMPGLAGRPALNVSALNARAGMAGRVANVAVLNGRGASGH